MNKMIFFKGSFLFDLFLGLGVNINNINNVSDKIIQELIDKEMLSDEILKELSESEVK